MTLRNNIDGVSIPGYSKKQETFNAISHFIGALFAIFICGFGIYLFINEYISLLLLIGFFVFGVSALAVYLVSSCYHIINRHSPKKKVLRILDHCTIYLLIAGTYTPICFSFFRANSPIAFGIFMLTFEWVGVIAGYILNAFFFQNKIARVVSFILYVLMGWLAVICGASFFIQLNTFLYILIGGIIYTIGSILYAFGHEWKWCHCIFHVFVLAGTIVQAIGIFLLR